MTDSVRNAPGSAVRARAAAADALAPGIDRLGAGEAAAWRRRLAETARPCGCKSGAVLSVAALVTWPVWTVASGPPSSPPGVGVALVSYALVVVAAGIMGKVAGIAAGRLHHRRLRRQLAQRVAVVSHQPER